MNSCVPVRFCAFDGKHRLFAILNFLIGLYDAQQRILLEYPDVTKGPYQEFASISEFGGVSRKSVVYETMQCFVSQTVHIGMSRNWRVMTGEEQYKQLNKYGRELTAAAKHHVQETMMSLFQEFISFMDNDSRLRQQLTPLNYETFWKKQPKDLQVVKANGKNIHDMFLSFANEKNKMFSLQAGVSSWKFLSDTMLKKLTNYNYPLGTADSKVGGLSNTVKPMVVFLKYFMSEEENYGILKSFIQQVDPVYPQGRPKMSYIAYFYSPKFLVKHVFGNLMKASCHPVNLLLIERRLIQKARLCTENKFLAEDIDGLWPKLCPRARKWAGSLPKLPASGYLNATEVGIAHCSLANNKFAFLVYQTVFVDAVATIVKYGWNPCLDRTKWEKSRQGNNKLLEL
jgi:hypothetical protein